MPGSRGVLVDALGPCPGLGILTTVQPSTPEDELFCPCESPAKGLESGWKSGMCLWWGN